jgi:hypothetical protein
VKALSALLLLAASSAFAQSNGPVTLKCIRETDTDAGLVQYNTTTNIVSIQGFSWNVVPDGTGIIVSGNLAVSGPYLRMNRFNGSVMARWRSTTPAGALDFVGVCEVAGRKF